MAGGGQAAPIFGWMARRVAFTMAEILLSLTIIGVVAAITLPSLMGNINERTWNTQRKALHARMSQAIAMMPQLNGYGTYVADTKDAAGSVTSSGTDTAAEAFLTEGLSKALTINNICDADNLADCGLPTTVIGMEGHTVFSSIPQRNGAYGAIGAFNWRNNDGEVESDYDIKTAALETQNGESVLVVYNPFCVSEGYPNATICANFLYDLNGNKGPNTVGKDVGFMTAMYSTDSVVLAPMPVSSQLVSFDDYYNMGEVCTALNPESRAPNYEEGVSLVYNGSFIVKEGGDGLAIGTKTRTTGDVGSDFYWGVLVPAGIIQRQGFAGGGETFCIKR